MGRLLRVLDEERFERILRVSQRIVNAQLAALPSGMVVVDGDSSTDMS